MAQAPGGDAEPGSAQNPISLDVRGKTLAPGHAARIPLPKKPQHLRNTHNTGPKGVKADYALAKHNLLNTRLHERIKHQRELHKKGQGVYQFDAMDFLHGVPDEKQKQERPDSDADSDLDDDDDAVFREYKQQRLKALLDELPSYGTYERVETLQKMVNIVKGVHEASNVVIHLYENHVEACVRLNLAFEDLAPQFPHVKFFRIRSTDAMDTFDDIGLPTLLVYRGGKELKKFVRVTDFLGTENFSDLQLVKWLAGEGVFALPGQGTPSKSAEQEKSDAS